MEFMHLHFTASSAPIAREACDQLKAQYAQSVVESPEEADAVIALGGDGFMLQCMQDALSHHKPVLGMNRGHKGFLMNEFRLQNLPQRLQAAKSIDFHPLEATISFPNGSEETLTAFNECTLRRMHCQTAHIRIRSFLDGKEKVIADELIGDGVIISTPLGSTGYYHSAGGKPIAWTRPCLGVQSVCVRPSLRITVPNQTEFVLDGLDPQKRPVIVSADNQERIKPAVCRVAQSQDKKATLLFDKALFYKKMILQHIR